MKADRNLKLNISCNMQRAQRRSYRNKMCITVLIICDYTVSTYMYMLLVVSVLWPIGFKIKQ